MVEAKAFLYTPPEDVAKKMMVRPIVHRDRHDAMAAWARSMGWTETPLVPAEALAERDALIAALREAETALRDYACYGPDAPCARPKHQCQFMECGGAASKALIAVLAALKEKTDDAC